MIDLPLVSIVTPSLNQGAFIRNTIQSVLNQDYPRLEYWVMDGGSTDNTITILDDYKAEPHFYWRSESDAGQASAIHNGWQQCQGQILAWLNTDDLYRPDAVSRAVATFQAHPDASLVYGRAALIDAEDRIIGQINNPSLTLKDLLGMVHFIPQPAVFFRATAVQLVGGLNTGLNFAFDLDLFLRLATLGPFQFINQELAAYRWHEDAKTATAFFQMRREAAKVVRRFLQEQTTSLPTIPRRHFLSYAHLVEGYACYRLGRRRQFFQHTMGGLLLSPVNTHWIIRRIWKHYRQQEGKELAYPYDPALF